jgi:hypothetical protein
MGEEAQKLLMMFINDGYSSSGKVSKATAIAMMRLVRRSDELQDHVNNSDHKAIKNYRFNSESK